MYLPEVWVIKPRKMGWGGGMYHIWGKGEVHRGSSWVDLREGDHLENLGIDGGMILEWILKKWGGGID